MSDNTTPHRAAAYDREVRTVIPYYDLFHRETIDLVLTNHPKAESWLDTGCGTGELIRRAYSHFPMTDFTLADPSPDMISQARAKLAHIPRSQLHFITGRTTPDLTMEKECFDIVSAIQSHHYLRREDKARAAQICHKLLKPNGIYIYFEHIEPDTVAGEQMGLARWRRYLEDHGHSEAEIRRHGRRRNTSYFPMTRDEHLFMLRNEGFRIVELFWYSYMQAGFYAVK